MELHNKDFNTGKSRQYEKIGKEIVKINELYVEYFGPVSLPLLLSYMDSGEKIRLFEEQRDFSLL